MQDIRRLQAFRSVAIAGSVRGAADRLALAPSAVSQHVRALERELGLVLFTRAGRRLALTPIGREVLAGAEQVFEALGALEDRATELRAERSERLAVGYFSSAGAAWIADLVAYLENAHPRVSVRLELTAGEVAADGPDLQLVVAGEHDLALAVPGVLDAELLLLDPYVAAVPLDHPLARREEVTLRELTALPWIDNDDLAGAAGPHSCRQVFVDACRTAGVDLSFRHQAHDYRTALEMVDRGLGATVLPRLGLSAPGANTATLPISDPGLCRSIHVVSRREGPDPAVIADARRALRDLVADDPTTRQL